MDDRALLLLMYVGSGLLAAGLALPLIRRRIPPNGLYGFRIPSTLNHPERWYAVNAAFGRWLLGSSLATACAALLLYRTPLALENYAWTCLAAFCVPAVIGIFVGLRAGRRIP